MPTIIPIRDLAKTAQISEMCHNSKEPIYVTKNGYADLIVMSAAAYEIEKARTEMYAKIMEAREDVLKGNVLDGETVMREIAEKYGF